MGKLRREMGRDGGFILAPAKSLQPETPTANAAAAIEEPTLRQRLISAQHKMNRDEVDAERQLRLGTEAVADTN